jgi:hypothetical protein
MELERRERRESERETRRRVIAVKGSETRPGGKERKITSRKELKEG